ncbi:MAG: GTP-binding protein [Clostridia bacterium]|nr:GTP-binding protein [Clostridia bacterium]MBR6915973.1 GTP-binding protein [Clostridia bacterium]
MTKVDIFSGFLGAGKTTLIKKLIKEAYRGEMIVVIENEFGKIGIDSGFLQEAGIRITEMNSGCICCSLVGDFGVALGKVKAEYDPDRIVIEPSGVGKLSDVIRAVRDAGVEGLELNAFTTVIDASKCAMYMKNFAEFYRNQIEFASSVIFSRTDGIREDKLADAERIVREINPSASLITTPWDKLDGRDILDVMEKRNTLEAELLHLLEEEKKKDHHHHHHHHEDGEECDDPECECHHHHDDEDDDDEHGHHHRHHEEEHEHHHHHHDDDDDDDDEHGHHHHHHHHEDGEECDDPECECHHHHDDDGHHHHHDHDADEVFTSWGVETAGKFTEGKIEDILDELLTGRYGMILRAKGIVDSGEAEWIHFDYVPGEKNVRRGPAGVTGKLCVIGTGLDKKGLAELFN